MRAGDGLEAVQLARSGAYEAVWVQLPVQGWGAEELLEELQRADLELPCVVQARAGEYTVSEGLRLVKLGAFDYLTAEASVEQMHASMEAAVARRRSTRFGDATPESWRKFLVGESAAMRHVAQTVRLISRRRCTILITGETGTGKEMAARAIHGASNRSHLPLVAVNCSALPENLLEAELFGHIKGAFTGAVANRVGRFEQADQGTIFLDEIGEMPLDLQAKLLRVLQEREFQRLGSSETVKVDARVIAACNADLHERVKQGRFREDLFYRLNVVPIAMPALRDRRGDISLLAQHFLAKVCRQEEVAVKRIAAETLERLTRYEWPGNVRQLENAVEMAIALSGERDTLYPGDFPLPSLAALKLAPMPLPAQIAVPEEGLDFEQVVGSIERGILEQALRRTNGNKKQAADLLRLKRTTLTAKLKSLQVSAGRAGV